MSFLFNIYQISIHGNIEKKKNIYNHFIIIIQSVNDKFFDMYQRCY